MHDLISAFEAPRNFAVFENKFLFGMLHPKSQAFHQLLSFKSSSNVRQALNENTKKIIKNVEGHLPRGNYICMLALNICFSARETSPLSCKPMSGETGYEFVIY